MNDFDKFYEKLLNAVNLELAGLIGALIFFISKVFFKRIKNDFSMWFSIAFSLKASSIAKIHIYLRRILYRLEGDRASLFSFTNGLVDPSNKSLLMTCISEVTEDGIASAISDRKKLIVEDFGNLLFELKNNNYFIGEDCFSLNNATLSGFLISQNTKYAGFHIVKDSSGNIYGFILIEFCNIINIDKNDLLKELKHTNDKISLLI